MRSGISHIFRYNLSFAISDKSHMEEMVQVAFEVCDFRLNEEKRRDFVSFSLRDMCSGSLMDNIGELAQRWLWPSCKPFGKVGSIQQRPRFCIPTKGAKLHRMK